MEVCEMDESGSGEGPVNTIMNLWDL